MKPKFKHAVKSFRGINRREDLVYASYNDGDLIIARRLPRRKPGESNRCFGNINSQLSLIYQSFSTAYKSDLATYTLMLHSVAYDPHKIKKGPYVVYTQMMWALKKRYPEIDLLTLTRDDILKHEYPIRSIWESMNTAFLLDIPEARMMDNKI